MSIAETAGAIKNKVANGLRDLRRGYTEEDFKRELRIYHGEITSEDRLRFKAQKADIIFSLANGVGLFPSAPGGPLSVAGGILGITSVLDHIERFNNLPDTSIDEMLASQARDKLESWHWHKRVPRIVGPNPTSSRKS